VRVLLYTMNYAPEMIGCGKFSGEMGGWLAERDWEVRVIASPPYYPEWRVRSGYRSLVYKKEIIKGVSLWRCPAWIPRKPTGVKRVLHLISFAISSFPIALRQALWRPNVIIIIEPPIACLPGALLVSWIFRSNTWLHIQDFEIDAGFDLGFVRSSLVRKLISGIERWLMTRVDKVSTISINMLKRLEVKGVEGGVLFPNWVDLEQIYPVEEESPYRKELNISSSHIVFLYSGNMGEKQGLEIIIESARHLAEKKNIVFVMCGQGAAYSRLREQAAGLGNMRWIPLQPLERLNDLLNIADIHLLPQRADAADLVMPSKLTGMLASGRPVLATALPETEVANAVQGAGLAVPPEDLGAFVNGLQYLIEHPEIREKMGREARKYAETRLDKKIILEKFEGELKELLN
jgi:colanic acid biosynthesis glycosyl transferase WcaI